MKTAGHLPSAVLNGCRLLLKKWLPVKITGVGVLRVGWDLFSKQACEEADARVSVVPGCWQSRLHALRRGAVSMKVTGAVAGLWRCVRVPMMGVAHRSRSSQQRSCKTC